MARHTLTLSERTEAALDAKAKELNLTHSELMRNAINTYCSLKGNANDDAVFFHTTNGDGKLVVKRMVLP